MGGTTTPLAPFFLMEWHTDLGSEGPAQTIERALNKSLLSFVDSGVKGKMKGKSWEWERIGH